MVHHRLRWPNNDKCPIGFWVSIGANIHWRLHGWRQSKNSGFGRLYQSMAKNLYFLCRIGHSPVSFLYAFYERCDVEYQPLRISIGRIHGIARH